jgi:hypothetical protein
MPKVLDAEVAAFRNRALDAGPRILRNRLAAGGLRAARWPRSVNRVDPI